MMGVWRSEGFVCWVYGGVKVLYKWVYGGVKVLYVRCMEE